MFKYVNNTILRQDQIEGIGPWAWIGQDDASWECPKHDWIHNKYRETILSHCTSTALAVQAGGCQGMYPRLLSDMFNHVYTFEPHPVNFHMLVANCQKDNITKINGALSDHCGQFTLIENEIVNSGCHTLADASHRKLIRETGKQYTVQLFTVDMMNLPALDLLMLDVESYEHNVLLGSIQTIKKYLPVIICEGDISIVTNLLDSIGYEKISRLGDDTIYKPKKHLLK